MWFMNKIANPSVRLILKSPLHRMMSATLLLIAYNGRKSGKEYTLPVQYVRNGQFIYIVPGTPEKKTWWRNLRGGAPVRLLLAGKAINGKATILEGNPEAAHIAQALDSYLRRFPASARMHAIRIDKDGSFNQDDLRHAALSTVVVRVDLNQ
jgi:deazaflavin-dependent oxidoreductase (nitroreductase family)